MAQKTPKDSELFTYFEVLSYPNSSHWLMAKQEKIDSLHKYGTWDLCKLPKSHRALTAKWTTSAKKAFPGSKM